MVRRKNVLGILMQCFVVLCILTLQWVLFGYSLAFSPGNRFIGSLNPHQLLVQLVAVAAVALYSLIATFIIYKAVDLFISVRVPTRDELLGLDLTQHNETAYTVLE
jgi:ammonia channel protein AmtB